MSRIDRLPRGIYYEARRQRYRVRIYKNNQVVYRSYHTLLEDALAALSQARAVQAAYHEPTATYDLTGADGQLSAFRTGAIR